MELTLHDEGYYTVLRSMDDMLVEVTTSDGAKRSGYASAGDHGIVLRPYFDALARGNTGAPEIAYDDITAIEVC